MKKIILFVVILTFCSKSYSQTQAEMNKAAAQGYYKADAELNKVYKALLSKLDENGKPLLVKAENDWIKYRESHCKLEASFYEGGSMQPMIYSSCLESVTMDRIKQLKAEIRELGEL